MVCQLSFKIQSTLYFMRFKLSLISYLSKLTQSIQQESKERNYKMELEPAVNIYSCFGQYIYIYIF